MFRIALVLCLLIATATMAGHAHAAEPPAPLPADATAEAVLEAFQARWKALADYSCVMITKVTKGPKVDRTMLQYAFKAPGLWRSKVIEGNDTGTTVAKGPDGRIRANAGGLLSAITITMAPDDARLNDPRGASLAEADWGFLITQFLKRREQGWKFERLPDESGTDGAACFVIQAAGPADKNGETRDLFLFDKATLAVRARRLYEGDAVVDDTLYKDVKLDKGLAADFFKL